MSRMDNTGAADQGQGQEGQGTATNLQAQAGQVAQQARDLGQQVKEQATQKYQQLREQATQYYDTSRQSATEWEQSLESYVRDQPVKSLLIAAGVGVVLGMVWKRS
ncbi:MAG TPA: DUF883 C-terminal domain-containing protein [Tepidisphaeraceae bacterium]|nr:DUF883 C-terminal domain-containing protein [Tepidisphaeraceae bacterium]